MHQDLGTYLRNKSFNLGLKKLTDPDSEDLTRDRMPHDRIKSIGILVAAHVSHCTICAINHFRSKSIRVIYFFSGGPNIRLKKREKNHLRKKIKF
jgi:hypothetical protein